MRIREALRKLCGNPVHYMDYDEYCSRIDAIESIGFIDNATRRSLRNLSR